MKEFVLSTNVEPSTTAVIKVHKHAETPASRITTAPIAQLTQRNSVTDPLADKCDDSSDAEDDVVLEIEPVEEEIRPVAIYSNRVCSQDASRHISLNTTSATQSNQQSRNVQTRIQRLRYPGDVVNMQAMSRQQLEGSLELCKKRLHEHVATIKSLRRQVRTKDRQLLTLRLLVKELKPKKLSETGVDESILS